MTEVTLLQELKTEPEPKFLNSNRIENLKFISNSSIEKDVNLYLEFEFRLFMTVKTLCEIVKLSQGHVETFAKSPRVEQLLLIKKLINHF